MQDIRTKITELMPWWEDVSIQGVNTKSLDPKAGRNKEMLFANLFDQRLGKKFFQGKSVVDLGCNAGGSTVQMLNRGASFVTCVEGADLSYRQLQLVIDNTADYKYKTKLLKYHLANKSEAELTDALGSHDIGFCIGLIYHMKQKDVVSLLRYMLHNTGRCMLSMPTTSVGRTTDWEISREGVDKLLEQAGFTDKIVLLDAKEGEQDWSWMTNTYYFEAVR